MTEYTVVLKNGHRFRVEADVPLPCALREAEDAGIPVIEKKTFALAVDEVAAIYPTKNGPKIDLSSLGDVNRGGQWVKGELSTEEYNETQP